MRHTIQGEKNKFLQNITATDNVPGHSRAVKEMYNKTSVFMPANMPFILQPMDEGVSSTFMSFV